MENEQDELALEIKVEDLENEIEDLEDELAQVPDTAAGVRALYLEQLDNLADGAFEAEIAAMQEALVRKQRGLED
jgi:hypothetical protein